MAFRLTQFGNLPISEYIQRGDTQDLGSGSAMTAFLSLPGGGFYDNFGTKVRPQNIQSPHKRGVLWGTDSELRTQLQAWRAKVGKREKLTAVWDDGEIRWKWAVLQDVSAPRPSEAKGGWLPIDLTWTTGMSGWRGPIHAPDAWVWGDDSWTFGDGSAEFGDEDDYNFVLADADEYISVVNNGDVDSTYMVLRVIISGSWYEVEVVNETTGQQILVERGGIVTDPLLEIDTSARTIHAGITAIDITSAYRDQNRIMVTAAGHGLSLGDTVRLAGTGIYDGDYYPVSPDSSSVFYVLVSPEFEGYGTVTDGTLQKLTSVYSVATISDRRRWMTLVPGANDIRILFPSFPNAARVEVAYYDQYA